MTRPLLLDLFCGAGGAAMGYHRAGFDILGVDIKPQKRYPFPFVNADAIEYLNRHGREFAAIHASPPCQAYARTHTTCKADPCPHVDLVATVREALERTRRPWVIENVPGAPLKAPLLLCGGAFALGATGPDDVRRPLARHRLFESPVFMMTAGCGCSSRQKVTVYGNGGRTGRPGKTWSSYQASKAEGSEALGIDWMTVRELSQAIPPAYTEHVGGFLLDAVRA